MPTNDTLIGHHSLWPSFPKLGELGELGVNGIDQTSFSKTRLSLNKL